MNPADAADSEEALVPILSIDAHPFYVGLLDPETRLDLPESLPFALGIHPRYAIPRLIITEEVRSALDKAYAFGSMCSTPLGESPLASVRMNEFRSLLTSVIGGTRGKRLLEIGCGNGELLNQFKLAGAEVMGIEIGPQATVVEERYGIRVMRELLAPGSLDEQFDCIYSYGCLEHIGELDEFFAGSRECLVHGGLFFHSVPNAALAFDRVELEHLQHEHVNYFTPVNGTALLQAQGFSRVSYGLTRAGNELMLWGFRGPGAGVSTLASRVAEESVALSNYTHALGGKTARTLDALRALDASGRSVGLYAGGYEYGFQLGSTAMRYFDGDSYKHGKRWLQRLPPIESPEALLARPVDRLIICKPHYFEDISRSLISAGVGAACLSSIDALGESSI